MLKEKKITAKIPLRTGVRKGIAVLFIVVVLMVSFVVPVSAENMKLAVNINKPRADEYSGYIEYLINNNGVIYPRVTFWHFSLGGPTSDDYAFPEVRVTVSDNRVVLNALFNDVDPDQYHIYNWVVGNVNGVDGGGGSQYASYDCENLGIINAFWDTSCQIMGYKIYGNGVSWDCTLDSGSYNWSVMYSETSVLYDAILSMAEASVGSSGSITQNATENAENIQQNQDKNTDKIIENDKQMQENEKTEANSTGDSGVNDVTNAIPDYSSSLLEAFVKLTDPMIHENTDCILTTPQIKVPKISGFIENDIVLLDSQEINIEYYTNELIPNAILIIVRSILTIVLFIFCYKELYGIIEYVMTLRGGRSE